MKRVLVTGPLERAEEYARAAREAGWEPIELPLLAIEARSLESVELSRRRYEWICITSASSLPFLAGVLARRPELREVPFAAVGERTSERISELGLPRGLAPAQDREALAAALIERARPGATVLWPRGSLSDDLSRALRAAGLDVEDPIAYSTRPLEHGESLPPTEAVFFASPSAVRAWRSRGGDTDRRVAIAIGRTTFEALALETDTAFADTISLPHPTPEAFGFVLSHLDPKETP